ncbi:MAG: AAA family ATPase [Candidatus Methanomethylicaceae archaeon]
MSSLLVNLSLRALQGEFDHCWGREREIREVIATLIKNQKNFPVLVGEAGVGKTTIVQGVAAHLSRNQVVGLEYCTIYELPYMHVAHASPEETGQIVQQIIQFLTSNPGAILFLDEMHAFFRQNQVFANALKPLLTQGKVKIIGATTPDEFSYLQRVDPALARRMWPIFVREMSPEQTRELLKKTAPFLERHHHVTISKDALDTAVTLSERLTHLRFPDKAVDLVDTAAAYARLRMSEKNTSDRSDLRPLVSKADVQHAFSTLYGDAVVDLQKALDNLEEALDKQLVGQEKAVKQVTSLLRSRVNYRLKSDSPLASLIFTGPPGTGKTTMAKLLAKHLFGSEDRLTVINVGNIGFSLTQLLGAPPGYIGSDRDTPLVAAIRTAPSRVLLFTGADVAHPWKHTSVLQEILSRGVIEDNYGRTLDFRQAIAIISVHQSIGGQAEHEPIRAKLSATLGSELVDLVDEIVVFEPLDRAAMQALVRKQVERLRHFVAQQYRIAVEIESQAVEHVVDLALQVGTAGGTITLVENKIAKPVLQAINLSLQRDEVLISPLRVTTDGRELVVSKPERLALSPVKMFTYGQGL